LARFKASAGTLDIAVGDDNDDDSDEKNNVDDSETEDGKNEDGCSQSGGDDKGGIVEKAKGNNFPHESTQDPRGTERELANKEESMAETTIATTHPPRHGWDLYYMQLKEYKIIHGNDANVPPGHVLYYWIEQHRANVEFVPPHRIIALQRLGIVFELC